MGKKKIPELRFKGFSGEWEERKIKDICGMTYGGGTPTTSENKYWNGDLPWIQSSNLVEGNLENPFYDKTITVEGLRNSAVQKIPANSIAVVTRVGFGKLALINFEYSTSQDFVSLCGLSISPQYAVYSIYKKLQSELQIVQGTSIKGITKDELLKKTFTSPQSISEQSRIGGFFAQLDRLIALHDRKHDKLVSLKKAMMEKMFPKPGCRVPELRFSGFNGDWEERKLGEVFDCGIKNNTITRDGLNYETGIVKNIHYGDVLIKLGAFTDISKNRIPFITDAKIQDFQRKNLLDGDIVLADTAEDETAGKATEIINVGDKFVVSGLHTFVLRPVIKTEPCFFGYYMNSSAYHDQLLPLMQGIKVMSLSKANIMSTLVAYPKDRDEQSRIGAYFAQFDDLIALERNQCDRLRCIKKALMEKMFV